MNNTFSFWNKFSHYLLIGLSSLVLFAGVQSGMVGDFTQRGPNAVLADEDQVIENPGFNTPSVPDDQQIPAPPVTIAPPPPVTIAPPPPVEVVPPPPPPAPEQISIPPPAPQCVPIDQISTTEHCLPGTTLWCTFNIWRGTDCSIGEGGPFACRNDARCGFQPAPPPPPVAPPPPPVAPPPPVVPPPAVVQPPPPAVCVPNGSCNAPFPACGQISQGVDNCNNSCFRRGPACPVTPPAAPPAAGPITINTPPITITTPTTPPISISNPSPPITVTVTNPAPQGAVTLASVPTREVVREVQSFGNVGVATSGVVTRVAAVQVQELPKTGLPALAWAALAFIPAGFKIRRFSKVKEEALAKPHYLWEDRQFKAG